MKAARRHPANYVRRIDPIAQFMQEHDDTLVQLSALTTSSKAIAEHGYTPEMFRRLLKSVEFIHGEVTVHNKKEEEALFPVLERYVEGPTGLMREEHRILKKEFTRLKRAFHRLDKDHKDKAAAQDVADVARGIAQIMVNHIHKENHILFPLVQKFLTKDALREIARRLTSTEAHT